MTAVRKSNRLYILAWVLMAVLLIVTLFGSYFMPHPIGKEYRIPFIIENVEGVDTKMVPPLPPSSKFWLGTDHRGFDMISLILNGAKYTLGLTFAVTLLRFVIALPIGLFAGVTGKGRKWIASMQVMTSSVPPLLFVFPTAYGISIAGDLNLGVAFNDPKEIMFMKVLFVMMVLIGVFSIAHQFAERAAYQSGRLFILASRTMGASSGQIVFRHVLPLLRNELWFAFLTEMVQVLFLIGQLAVVQVFVGGGEKVQLADATPFSPEVFFLLTGNGEWGGLISYGSHYFREYPWIILSVGVVFAASIMILMFFSSQLQLKLSTPVAKRRAQTNMQRRGKLALAVVATACFAFLALRPIFFQEAVPVATPTDQTDVAKPKIDPEYQKQLTKFATDFVTYLSNNQWEYAFVMTAQSASVFPGQETPPPPHPFETWVEMLNQKQFKVTEIGNIQLTGEKQYVVEITVSNDQGAQGKWYLTIRDGASSSGAGSNSMRVEGGQGDSAS